MTREWLGFIAILVAAVTCRAGVFDSSSAGRKKDPAPIAKLAAVDGAAMCATLGDVRPERGTLSIASPKTRAIALGSAGDATELAFTYDGPTEEVAPLASGEIRRQVGLKLRAEDGCNVVYAMWRFEPRSVVEVQVKHMAGARTHEACGVEGYSNIRPKRRKRVKAPQIGSEHTMRAEIVDNVLTVWIDGRIVWQGELDEEAAELSGPAGIRTDNVAITGELRVAAGDPNAGRDAPGCRPEDAAVEIEIEP